MAGKGLIIGIDYTEEYCQACYYSFRHRRPESVSAGTDVMRYLIPSVLCRDPDTGEWAIGNSAVRIAGQTGSQLYTHMLQNALAGNTSSLDLLAAYFGKLLEFIQIRTAVMAVENITVTMRHVDRRTKEALEYVFGVLNISKGKVRLLSSAESFGYFMIHEDPQLWKNGTLLFDFPEEGFYAKHLNIRGTGGNTLIYVDEYDFSGLFSMKNLASEMLRSQLDGKLSDLYRELTGSAGISGVYFTGDGFESPWYADTLNRISGETRVFKGNNIYVKGACLAGFLRATDGEEEYRILCAGRTRAEISLEAFDRGKPVRLVLSPAAVDWYDAGYQGDFILEKERGISFEIRSAVSGRESKVTLDLSGFPTRPEKTTRVQVQLAYDSENECTVTVRDKGFGDFYRGSGAEVTQRINMEGYI